MSTTGDIAVNEECAPVEEPQATKTLTKTLQAQASVQLSPEPKPIQSAPVEPKLVEPKLVEPKSLEPKATEPKIVAPKVTQSNPQPQVLKTKNAEQNEGKSSDQTCRYYLGYLSQRDKGEGIPDTCVECNRSLDCMLSEYYKSQNTVAEIKKWYHPKL
jgi:hypothetical protein